MATEKQSRANVTRSIKSIGTKAGALDAACVAALNGSFEHAAAFGDMRLIADAVEAMLPVLSPTRKRQLSEWFKLLSPVDVKPNAKKGRVSLKVEAPEGAWFEPVQKATDIDCGPLEDLPFTRIELEGPGRKPKTIGGSAVRKSLGNVLSTINKALDEENENYKALDGYDLGKVRDTLAKMIETIPADEPDF